MTKDDPGADKQTSRHLADRYSELRRYRSEAFAKYSARELDIFKGPPVSLTLPAVNTRRFPDVKKTIGPFCFYDTPPVQPFVVRALEQRPLSRVLEIGPGGGELAASLLRKFSTRIETYHGFDRDQQVRGAFLRVGSLDELTGTVDLVIASEVIEHMSADELAFDILDPLRAKLSPKATMVISTPNPTAPGGIARDFSHVQNYPWYDLYAIFRLFFERVQIYRAFYAYSGRQLLQLVPRMAVCSILDIEWCNGLVCVATNPRRS